MKRLMIVMLAGVLISVACGGAKKTERIIVASEQADCVGVMRQKCLLIKHEGSETWQLWYSGIEGFEFVPGYEYVLEIRKERDVNPAADRSSIRYILVKQISKTEKESEGITPLIRGERQQKENDLQLQMEDIIE